MPLSQIVSTEGEIISAGTLACSVREEFGGWLLFGSLWYVVTQPLLLSVVRCPPRGLRYPVGATPAGRGLDSAQGRKPWKRDKGVLRGPAAAICYGDLNAGDGVGGDRRDGGPTVLSMAVLCD